MGRSRNISLATGEEQTLYRVLEAIPEAALVADDEGRYIYANAAALELTGRTRGQLRKLTLAQIAAPGQPVDPLWSQFTSSGALQGDFELLLPEGTTVMVEFKARTDIVPGLHVSFLRDVTDRRRIERRMRRDQEKFIQAFVQAPVAMAIRVLESGIFVEANNEFQALSGRWRSEVIGRTGDEMGLWEDRQPAADLMAQLRHGVPACEAMATLITRSGQARKIVLSGRRVEIDAELHAVMACVPL